MGATLKKATITLGLVTLPVKVKTAVGDADTKLSNVCLGHAAITMHDETGPKKGEATVIPAVEHAPAKVKTKASFGGTGWLVCPVCENDDASTFAKGKDTGGAIVIVPPSELEGFMASDEVKTNLALTAHLTTELVGAMPSGKVYWLDVEAPAMRKVYAMFVRLLKDRPDISYVAEFAVRSLAALYKLDVWQDALCIRELAWPELIEPAPEVDLTLPSDQEVGMAIMLAEMALTPFDAADYRNQRAESLAAFLASAEAVEGMVVPTSSAAVKKTGVDLTAVLAAALEAAAPKPYTAIDVIREAVESVGWDLATDRPIEKKPVAKRAKKAS